MWHLSTAAAPLCHQTVFGRSPLRLYRRRSVGFDVTFEQGGKMKLFKRTALLAVLVAACAAAALATGALSNGSTTATASGPCQLGTKAGQVKHVIYLQFDNTHYRRDRANVASDLEQMPHLLNFLKGNGTLLTNDHTILISHTAGGILASLTGLYPDRNGQTVSNSYDYFKNDGTPQFTSSFKYWTDTVDGTNETMPNMVGDGGQTTPAPWLTYTHAGCNVGGVSSANIVLENNSTTASGDMTRVFGVGLARVERGREPGDEDEVARRLRRHRRSTARRATPLCDTNPNAKPDDSTIDPGLGRRLQGALRREVRQSGDHRRAAVREGDTTAPTSPTRPATAASRASTARSRRTRSAMVAQMQENGVPVTFAYISDAHDNHTLARASGPGEADYKQQLADYDAAFATFFQRLASRRHRQEQHALRRHRRRGRPLRRRHRHARSRTARSRTRTRRARRPSTTCPANQIGEVNVEHEGVRCRQAARRSTCTSTTRRRSTSTASPTRTDPAVRKLERDLGAATAFDPYANATRAPRAASRRHGRGADAAHGQRRPEADADVHVLRQLRLLLPGVEPDRVRRRRRCRRASTRSSPGTTATSRTRSPTRGSGWSVPASRGTASTRRPGPITSTSGRRSTRSLGLSRLYEDDGRVITQVLDDKASRSDARQRGRRPSTQLGDAVQAAERAVRLVRARHARRVDRGDPVDRRAEVRLDRDADREPDRQAGRARGHDPRSAQRRRRRAATRSTSGQAHDWIEAGAEPDRPGSRAGCCFIAGRSASTSEGSSSRHAPGSSPSSVERAVAAAMQPLHAVADGLEHALHLPVASLVDRQLDVGAGDAPHLRRRGLAPSSSSFTPSASLRRMPSVGCCQSSAT